MTKQEYAEKFEDLVGKRFRTIAELENYIHKKFNNKHRTRFDFSYINYEEDFTPDWDLCTYIENDEMSCDLDVYFLYDREQRIYITEVGYEIEMVED